MWAAAADEGGGEEGSATERVWLAKPPLSPLRMGVVAIVRSDERDREDEEEAEAEADVDATAELDDDEAMDQRPLSDETR